MGILIKHSETTKRKISEMPIGSEAGLAQIFGDAWEAIGTIGERRDFGRKFKTAVKENLITELEWVRIENSGRFDVYRRK